jgi:hypothetical protein
MSTANLAAVQPGPGKPLTRDSRDAFRAADATTDARTKEQLLQEAQSLAGQSALADAYSYLQKAVGLIAVTLPFVVAIGGEVSGDHAMKGSISAYYYTHMGNYFVGSLFALGVFFLSYNYRTLPNYRFDNYLSNFACLMAVGVALLPTASNGHNASGGAQKVAILHLVCACTLFVLLAVFSLVLFTRTDGSGRMTPAKRRRNLVYRTCGAFIVLAIALVLVAEIVQPPSSWHALFWLESVAVVAFGVSWLVKGAFLGLLADR